MGQANTSSFALLTSCMVFMLSFFLSTDTYAQCTLVCNNLVQISLDQDCSVELDPDMILEGSGCPNGNFQVQAKVNGIWVPATGNYVVTASDINKTLEVRVRELGSGQMCWGNILVEDKLPPVVTCTNLTVPCALTNFAPSYLSSLGLSAAFPTVVENCSQVTQSFSDEYFDLDCTQTINGISGLSAYIRRTWVVSDASGNQSSCTQFVYLDRVNVNEITLPSDITVSCTTPVTDPTSTGVPSYTFNGTTFGLFPNNTACELNMIFADQILPICDGSYKILRTWTVYDWCLPTQFGVNPVNHIQVIKVEDKAGPVAQCPTNVTVSTDPFVCVSNYDLPDFIVTDNCSRMASISATFTVNGVGQTVNGSFSTFPGNNIWDRDTLAVVGVAQDLPLGPTLVRYTITDDCGNTSTCQFTVTVEDGVPPSAVCDQITKVSLGINGVVNVNATTFDDGSYDNCSPVTFKARRMDSNGCQSSGSFYDQVSFCCEDIGNTVMVVFRVYDVPMPAGDVSLTAQEDHSNDCMVEVLVEDKIKPSCQAPANVTVSCKNFDPSLWAYGQPAATDNCCLDTILTNVVLTQFDTVCNKGTITRRFTARDCAGQTTQCSQRIIVNYEQDYWVRFPNDVIVTFCDSSGVYGQPTFSGEDCELLAVSFTDVVNTVVPDACFLIERTWRIINWCTYDVNAPCIEVPNPEPNATANHPSNLPGPIVSPLGTLAPWAPTVVRIRSTDPSPTNYSTFWNANANCYVYKQIIKIIDGQRPIVDNCPASPFTINDLTSNDPQLYNEMYFWDPVTSSHDLCEAPSELTITASDLCSGSDVNFRYLLFLDMNQDGDMETVISSTNLPGFNTIRIGNGNTQNYAGGTPRAFDFRPVPANQKWGFALQTTVVGGKKTARVAFNTQQSPTTFVTPQLPHGRHKIKWFVNDNCGNETVCEYEIIVRDGKKPTIVCEGKSVNIMPTGMITLWASDFLTYGEDNCTPNDRLVYAIQKKGGPKVFPRNAQGNPITDVTFGCSEVGTQFIELWAVDLAGNADYCETFLNVQDNMGSCTPGNKASVAGAVMTDFNLPNTGLESVNISIDGVMPNGQAPMNYVMPTNKQGEFVAANLPIGGNFTFTPLKDDNHLNGVSTYDLVLISKHILGLEPLNSPYKMIAADANKSGSITTFDIVELRKLILGVYSQLPNNTSWRFVDANHQFANPANPFQSAFPETANVAQLPAAGVQGADFVAIKTGDVNGSAIVNSLTAAADRTSGQLYFDAEDRLVRAGEVITVGFRASDANAAYQFTMNLNGLEAVEVVPGVNMHADNFALFANAVTASVDGHAPSFEVTFRAQADGRLSNMIGVSNSITQSEAYAKTGERLDVAFRFDGQTVVGAPFELLQNVPNPAAGSTQISFFLPEASDATLTISNLEGRILKVVNETFVKGLNTVLINTGELESGILFYQLDTPANSATKKMVVVK